MKACQPAFLFTFLLWSIQLLQIGRADDDDLDYYQEAIYQSSYTVSDLVNEGWTVLDSSDNPINPRTYQCNDNTFSSFDGIYFTGPYTQSEKPTILFQDLPPHYQYSIYIDLIFLQDWGNNMFVIQDNTDAMNKIVSASFPDVNDPAGSNSKTYCSQSGGAYFQFFQKYSHVESNLSFTFLSSGGSRKYIIGYMQLSLGTCHYTCGRSCSGPYSTDCLDCPQGQVNGGVCTCNSGYAYNHECVGACPSNYYANPTTMKCEKLACGPACQTCDSVYKVCKSCTGGFYLSEGYCVQTCPLYSTLAGSKCVGPIDQPGITRGYYVSKGLFSPRFSNFEISRMGFVTSGFSLSNMFTTCGDIRLLGGWETFQNGSFTLSLSNIPPHHTIHIEFNYLIIDKQNNNSYTFKLDSLASEIFQNTSGTTDYCGLKSQNEDYISFKMVSPHTSSGATLLFQANNSAKFYQSFGIRELVIYIEKCSDNCISCDTTDCLKCAAGYYLSNNTCVKVCPSSFFPSEKDPASCLPCHSTCKECFGDQIDNCTVCFNSDFLEEKKCIGSCSSSYYPVYTPQYVCLKCHATCAECNGPNKTQCLKCQNPYYLYGTSCVYGSKCPQGNYPDSSDWKCKDCDTSCKTCTGPANNQCSSCAAYLLNGTCYDTCDPGYFGNTTYKICEKCDSQCTECALMSSNCTKCTGTLYLIGTTCDPNCPVGFYPLANASGNLCVQCDSKCASCSGPGPSACKSCNPGTYLTTKSTCETSCLSNEYQDEQRRACKPCDITCSTCNGALYNNCLTCSDPYYRTPTYTCEKTCPTYFYPDVATQFCKDCHSTCLTCTGKDESQCLKCDLGRFLYNGYCKLSCPEEYYENGTTQSCDPCYSNCKTCSGPLDNQCIGCKSGLYFYKNQCLTSCPDGTWHNKQSMRCSPCDLTCKTCSGGSVNQCVTCNVTRYYMSGQCISSCPDGYFNDIAINKCTACHPNCRTCFERNDNQCESCYTDRFLNIETHICVQKCPAGQYGENKVSSLCQTCYPSCEECSSGGENGCTVCPNNRFFVENSCLTDCPAGYFKVTGNNVCQACYSSCAHCLSPSKSACLNCKAGYFFYNNQCIQKCPDGMYGNTISLTCEACDLSCKTCSNKYYNTCNSCYNGSYLLKGICIENCPSRYAQIGNGVNKCVECDISCLTCSISDPTVCLSCAQGWYLLNNQCLKKCPLYYYTNSIQNKCIPCPDTCEVCSDPTKSLEPCVKWERNLSYTDFLMFWVVLGLTIFCFISLLIGFYLDSIVPNRSKIKILRDKYRRTNQIFPEPLGTQNDLKPIVKNGKYIQPGEDPEYINGRRKTSKQLNQIEEIDSFEADPKKQKQIIFSNEEPSDPKKKVYDPTVDPPSKKTQIQKNGTMMKFDGDIRQKSDVEVLNIIIPKSRILNLNKHKGDNLSDGDPNGPVSLAFIPEEEERQKKKRNSPLGDDDDSNSQASQKQRGDNASVTYSSVLLQNKKNQNNTTVASMWQDNSTKGNSDKGRGFIRTFVEFFEVTSILVRYSEDLSRPIRVMLVFSKFLFLIWISSPDLNLNSIYIFLSLIGMKMFMNGVRFILTKIAVLYYKLIYVFFVISILYVVCNNTYQFYPQLDWISLNQDRNWAFIFVLVVAADFIIIQGLFFAIQYIITRYNTFSMQQTCPQRFLSIFCFEKQISEFITTK